MTIEEYRDKHFPNFEIVEFLTDLIPRYVLDDKKAKQAVNLCIDGVIVVSWNDDFESSNEMLTDLKELIKTDKNFKEWRRNNK